MDIKKYIFISLILLFILSLASVVNAECGGTICDGAPAGTEKYDSYGCSGDSRIHYWRISEGSYCGPTRDGSSCNGGFWYWDSASEVIENCADSGEVCVSGNCVAPPCTPEPEICDGIDNDCDGTIDNGPAETCDWVDNDCDGLVDELDSGEEYGLCSSCETRYQYINSLDNKAGHTTTCLDLENSILSELGSQSENLRYNKALESFSADALKDIYLGGSCTDLAAQTWEEEVSYGLNCSDGSSIKLTNDVNGWKVVDATDSENIYGLCENTKSTVLTNLAAKEICNGVDDDCDGSIDEEHECIKGTDGCDSDCSIIRVNEAPVVSFDGIFSGYIEETINVSGACSDSDGTVSSCVLQVSENDCTISISSAGTGTASATATMDLSCTNSGNKTVEIIAMDNGGETTVLGIEVNVIGNFDSSVLVENTSPTVPEVVITANSRNAGATLTCDASSKDPDVGFTGGQTLAYTYKFFKNGDEINGFNEENDWLTTSTIGGEGSYTCTSEVCDSAGACEMSGDSLALIICDIYSTWDEVTQTCIPNVEVPPIPPEADFNTFICSSKETHTVWDDVASYIQFSLDGTVWVPENSETLYSATEQDSNGACFYVCEEGFVRSGGACVSGDPTNIRSTDCIDPVGVEHYVWTSNNLDVFTQWKIGNDWIPTTADVEVAKYLNDPADSDEPCMFVCEDGYSWNGTNCVAEIGYCGLVAFEADLITAEIGNDYVDLTYAINCADPDSIPGGTETIVTSVTYEGVNSMVNTENISTVCLPDPVEITTRMDTNTFGSYIASFYYGPEEFNCSRDVTFGLTDDFGITGNDGERLGGSGGDDLQIPDNNLLLVLILLASVSLVLTRKRSK